MLLTLLNIILVSIVIFQLSLAYFVYSKFGFLRLFKIRGVGLRHLYVVGLFLSPLISPFIVLAVFVVVVKGFFKRKTVLKPDFSSVDGINDFVRGFK